MDTSSIPIEENNLPKVVIRDLAYAGILSPDVSDHGPIHSKLSKE